MTTPRANALHLVDFIFIYLGGAFLAGALQQVLHSMVPGLFATTGGRLLGGLWLQDLIMLALIAFFLHLRKARWRDLGFRRPCGRHPYLGAICAGVGLYLLMVVLIQLTNVLWPHGLAPQNVETYLVAGDALGEKLFVFFTMGAFVPLVEELLFRGYLYQSLAQDISPRLAMLFTALIFGCAHFDVQRALPLAIGGYLLNLICVRYQSVWASAISHGVWNSIMILLYYLAL